jgi:glycosyltransferase involved in cell wall biosynthesis
MRIALNAWFLDQPGTGSGQYLRNLLWAMLDIAPDQHFLLVAPPGTPPRSFSGLERAPSTEGTGSPSPASRSGHPQLEYWSSESRPLRPKHWRSNLGKLVFEQVTFAQACRQWRADLAHLPYWGSPLRPPVPTVVTIHDLIPRLLPAYRGGPLVRLYTHLVSASAQRAQLVLTDSLASQRDIEAHLGLSPERIRCVYLAAGEQYHPNPEPADEPIRAHYGLTPESLGTSRYVLYLASHDERKNVATLVEAFSTVAASDDDVTLVIGGKLPEQSKPPFYDPRPLVKALGLMSDVRFIGWVEEDHKPALYRGASCAVFPSRYEGFGLPVLEALACGTPLVAANTSSLPELIGDAGFALDPDDAQGMAGAILACLVDEPLAAELRRRGPQQAARFTWAQTARQTLAAYHEAAPSPTVGAGSPHPERRSP